MNNDENQPAGKNHRRLWQKVLSLRPGVRYILYSTMLFSLMQIGVKYLGRLPSQEIVFFRSIILLIFGIVMVKRQGLALFGNNKPFLILRGFAGAIALSMFFLTIQHVPLATAVTLQYLSPIFTILLSPFIMKESATARQWVAFLMAMGGVLIMRGFDSSIPLLYMATGIISATASGVAYNCIRKLKDSDHPLVIVLYFPLITIPVIAPFLLIDWVTPNIWEWILLVLVALCTYAAQITLTKAYQLERVSDISIFKYLGILFALFFGIVLFDEIPTIYTIIGMTVVIVGVYLGSLGIRAKSAIANV